MTPWSRLPPVNLGALTAPDHAHAVARFGDMVLRPLGLTVTMRWSGSGRDGVWEFCGLRRMRIARTRPYPSRRICPVLGAHDDPAAYAAPVSVP